LRFQIAFDIAVKTRWIFLSGWLALGLNAASVASVGPDRAARLQTTLTPLGAERAGNAAGTLPAWTGPAASGPSAIDDAQPLYVVTAETAAKYAVNLSEGQRALLASLPGSYSLPVYPAHRRAGAPAGFYAGTLQNATHAFIDSSSPAPQAAITGIPFPVLSQQPSDAGLEAIWNHRLRWRGVSRTRQRMQITASTRGDLGVTRVLERQRFQSIDSAATDGYGVVLGFILRGVIEPRRLAGTIKLSYDPLQAAAVAWQRSPNQPRIQKTQSTGDDTPMIGAEGLFNEDQAEGFSGSPSRYDWKLLGKRELLVPYDAAGFDGAAPDDIFGPRHIRPGLARYELHRVHVVEARLKPTLSSPFARRVFYLDEDSWQVLLADLYDRSDRLVCVQEVHTRIGPEGQLVPTLETAYDLIGRRYFAAATTNRDTPIDYSEISADEFKPSHVEAWARRAGIVPADDRGTW
jgi:hypothetical protein